MNEPQLNDEEAQRRYEVDEMTVIKDRLDAENYMADVLGRQRLTSNAYLVTIKLPRNPQHDPKNKKTGPCPMSGTCTDYTGEHHTGLVFASSIEEAKSVLSGYHITRVELVLPDPREI